jgi:hypothetical protein
VKTNFRKNALATVLLGLFFGGEITAQGNIAPSKDASDISRISLFTSGVGFFEHEGNVEKGDKTLNFKFSSSVFNDVLKSLSVTFSSAQDNSVIIRYPPRNMLNNALSSLALNINNVSGIQDIFRATMGHDITVRFRQNNSIAANVSDNKTISKEDVQSIRGRIMSCDAGTLSLFSKTGIVPVPLEDIRTFIYSDPELNKDVERALDLIRDNSSNSAKILSLDIKGPAQKIIVNYVLPTPVWKVTYRLNITNKKAALQAYAIIDNDSNVDWNNVELSLVSGRPVSFIQNLYEPFHSYRPTLPLAIAGSADAFSYDDAWKDEQTDYGADAVTNSTMRAKSVIAESAPSYAMALEGPRAAYAPAAAASGGRVLGAAQNGVPGAGSDSGTDEGWTFEWKFKDRVTIQRQMSVMLPMLNTSIDAIRTLVFKGEGSGTSHPQEGLVITNTTSSRLPPGPVTVLNDGIYGGDALLNYLSPNEKAIISYAEDLSVSGTRGLAITRNVSGVKISGGVLNITRKTSYEQTYTFNNSSENEKTIIIEHPKLSGATLSSQIKADEETNSVYRFNKILPAKKRTNFVVAEESPSEERYSLANFSVDSFFSYASNMELNQNVRAALNKLAELKRETEKAKTLLNEAQDTLKTFQDEQQRIRNNITAVGPETEAGKTYINRLTALDDSIDTATREYRALQDSVKEKTKAFTDYLERLEI